MPRTMQIAMQHYRAGRWAQAEAAFRQLLQSTPQHTEALHHLGNVYQAQGKLDAAIACYQRVLALNPGHALTHFNLGVALQAARRLDQAAQAYANALSCNPRYAEASYNLGYVLQMQGDFWRAAQHYQQAIEANSKLAQAHNNLGRVWQTLGQLPEAIQCFQKALALRPDYAWAYDNLLMCMNYASGYDPQALFEAHRGFGRQFAIAADNIAPHANTADPERRLKIGYLSPDFREHAIAYFIQAVIAAHDRSQIEVFCYSSGHRHDAVTAQIQTQTDHWRDLAHLSDAAADACIRADGIDILVDLAGHTAGNRLPLFARKPAPIQMTWLGFPQTTGLDSIDYRISDAFVDPPGMTDALHSEKILRLPAYQACFQPDPRSPAVSALPALTQGYVTFASLNTFSKVNAEVIALWSQLLLQRPDARLLLVLPSAHPQWREALRPRFGQHGIAMERLTLVGPQPFEAFMQMYAQIDIALDPFPSNGVTTTLHSLWMGVPVVTLAGQSPMSRGGVSIMHHVGLNECIAQDPQEYLRIAQGLADNLPHLANMRAGLRERMAGSALTDTTGFTHHLESAYRKAWQQWCQA